MAHPAAATTKKRKAAAADDDFRLDDLNQDLLERVLARLPLSAFFRLRSVCRRWFSAASSPSFLLACSLIPSRPPWYLMAGAAAAGLVFDSTGQTCYHLPPPPHLSNYIPVAAAAGIVCYRSPTGDLAVCNPLTGAARELPSIPHHNTQSLHAIAMTSHSSSSRFRIILISGDLSNLAVGVFDSQTSFWQDPIFLHAASPEATTDGAGDTLYFLSKAGAVVAANTQRSVSKQYSSVVTMDAAGDEVVYFLSRSGAVVACNLARKTAVELPRLLPVCAEYSIDVVECAGEMLVVVLSEFLETASVRAWRYEGGEWRQAAAMPPAMSHGLYGKRADVNCAGSGAGGEVLVCVSSCEASYTVVCDVANNRWTEVACLGHVDSTSAAFAFEPRVEAEV